MITNGMNLLGVQTYWQMLIKGLILVLALIVDVLESRKKIRAGSRLHHG